MKLLFEGIPVFLALFAILFCAKKAAIASDMRETRINLLKMLAAVIMIVAQLHWTWTYLIQGHPLSTGWVDSLWTVFNALVMIIFILSASRKK